METDLEFDEDLRGPPKRLVVQRLQAYLAEFIATFWLLCAITFPAALQNDGFDMGPWVAGLCLAIAILVTAPVSGGSVNPAVNLILWLRSKIDHFDLIGYTLFQVLGGVAACALCNYMTGKLEPLRSGGVWPYTVVKHVICELMLSFFLTLTVAAVATAPEKWINKHAPWAIGLTVTTSAYIGGPLSGASMNPAVGLSIGIMRIAFDAKYTDGITTAIQTLAPLGGALIAILAFWAMRHKTLDRRDYRSFPLSLCYRDHGI
eukprot:Filipodium_phascolosomae@DN8020_c0_g1_i1.p1